MQRLRQLEDENQRLKHIVAEQTLDVQALKAVVAKSGWPHRAARVHAAERLRFGYRRLHTLVDREGLHVNHKRVYGVYCQAGLQVRGVDGSGPIGVANSDRQPVVLVS